MGQPAAKQGDRVIALDPHLIQPPGPVSPVMVPHPFSGILNGNLSPTVKIQGRAAATVDSTATNTPPHVPMGGTFVNPPTNRATVVLGSATVKINGKAAARMGDRADTCNDAGIQAGGQIVAVSTVLIGG